MTPVLTPVATPVVELAQRDAHGAGRQPRSEHRDREGAAHVPLPQPAKAKKLEGGVAAVMPQREPAQVPGREGRASAVVCEGWQPHLCII